MKLSIVCIWMVAAVPVYAYMVDRQVVKNNKPLIAVNPKRKNAPLTPAEQCQLFQLDRHVLDQRVSRANKNAPLTSLTDQDRSELWHLHDTAKQATATKHHHEPYTFEDRAQLWHLNNNRQEEPTRRSGLPPRMSSQDFADLLPQTYPAETKLADHGPYTAQDWAQLWHLPNKPQQHKHKFRLLSNQERAQLWHLNDNNDKKVRRDQTVANGETAYTDQDLQLLWHLDEQARLLHAETKHQVYSDQDRAQLWHLDLVKHHDANENKTKEGGSYTDQDRARLWHLEDHAKGHEGTKNAPYTAQDYQELWHL